MEYGLLNDPEERGLFLHLLKFMLTELSGNRSISCIATRKMSDHPQSRTMLHFTSTKILWLLRLFLFQLSVRMLTVRNTVHICPARLRYSTTAVRCFCFNIKKIMLPFSAMRHLRMLWHHLLSILSDPVLHFQDVPIQICLTLMLIQVIQDGVSAYNKVKFNISYLQEHMVQVLKIQANLSLCCSSVFFISYIYRTNTY